MDGVWKRLGDVFSWHDLTMAFVARGLPSLVAACAVFTCYYVLWKVLDRGALALQRRSRLDKTAHAFLAAVLRYVMMTIALVSALSQLGVDTGALLGSLGVAGLTIGFAARDAMSNVISGIFIFWDRPFVVDDLIEIGGSYGRVAEITMRSTRVVTVDGKMLAIPNTQIINSVVASYTNFPNLRLDIDLTVAVDEDLGRARRLLLAIVADDPRFMKEPQARVVVKALNDYNVALQLQAWIVEERNHVAVRFELRERCFEALRAAGVQMPFETIEVRPPLDARADRFYSEPPVA
jgi:small conductance mechanosensitive channel